MAFMDRNNITTAILSLPAPATVFNATGAAAFYRQQNEYMANLSRTYPDRYGFYAGVPSPNFTDACIGEIQYAMDHLGANGVMLLDSYDGQYLGLPAYKPVWDELNKRKAIVLLHPGFYLPIPPITQPFFLNSGLEDWTFETTRTATSLVLTQMKQTHPDVKIILPHAGGTVPYVVNRIAQFQQTNMTADQVKAAFQTFYFDLAVSGFVGPMNLVLDFAQPAHVFYGSDFPFTSNATIATENTQIAQVLNGRSDASTVLHKGAAQLFGGHIKCC